MDEKDLVRVAEGRRTVVQSSLDQIVDGTGVTVAICTHNGATRLPETLAHLARQSVPASLLWEVLVIDNASTDGSGEIAARNWPATAPAPLRVVHESQLGLSNARRRAFQSAQYEYVSFVDDDNWVNPDWVATVAGVMRSHSDVGACGGLAHAEFEIEPPSWFREHQASYAVGPQDSSIGGRTLEPERLYGAGLTVRRAAWQRLVNNGFEFLLADRSGAKLSSGGDTELCCALRLAGYKLLYEPRLQLRHFIPVNRLRWAYLRKLNRGLGASTVELTPYIRALHAMRGVSPTFRDTWLWKVLSTTRYIMARLDKVISSNSAKHEGAYDDIILEFKIGQLFALMKCQNRFRNSRPVLSTTMYTDNEQSRYSQC